MNVNQGKTPGFLIKKELQLAADYGLLIIYPARYPLAEIQASLKGHLKGQARNSGKKFRLSPGWG